MPSETKDEMRERILDSALKRFSYYGASKTTMNEIAVDLDCSKACLYYYFPDKYAVHMAVLEKVGEIYFEELEKDAAGAISAADALRQWVDTRHEFVKRFFRLDLFKMLSDKQVNQTEIFKATKEREAGMIAAVIRRGIENGEFAAEDPERVARVYLHAMTGLRMAMLAQQNLTDEAGNDVCDAVVDMQADLAEIFIKGLKR